jgi:hypothetical protein
VARNQDKQPEDENVSASNVSRDESRRGDDAPVKENAPESSPSSFPAFSPDSPESSTKLATRLMRKQEKFEKSRLSFH